MGHVFHLTSVTWHHIRVLPISSLNVFSMFAGSAMYKSFKIDNTLEDKLTESTESKNSANHVPSLNGTNNLSVNTSATIERSMWGAR